MSLHRSGSSQLRSDSDVGSSLARRHSVQDLVDFFENQYRISRSPSTRIQRAATPPSNGIRRRYSSVLNSQEKSASDKISHQIPAHSVAQHKREVGSESVKEVPSSRTTDVDIGVVTGPATDRTTPNVSADVKRARTSFTRFSDPFDARRAFTHTRSVSFSTSPDDLVSMGRQKTRAGAVLDASKPESPEARQSIKPRRVRRRSHSLSEFTRPKSSPICAQGLFVSANGGEQAQREAENAVSNLGSAAMQEEDDGGTAAQAAFHEADQPESSDQHNQQPCKEQAGSVEKRAIEKCLFVIHEDDHAIQAIDEPGPSTVTATTGRDIDLVQQHTTGTAPVAGAVADHSDDVQRPPSEGASVTGQDCARSQPGQSHRPSRRESVNKAKKRKLVGKARRVILRKKVLEMMLGRELANTIHPLLRHVSVG